MLPRNASANLAQQPVNHPALFITYVTLESILFALLTKMCDVVGDSHVCKCVFLRNIVPEERTSASLLTLEVSREYCSYSHSRWVEPEAWSTWMRSCLSFSPVLMAFLMLRSSLKMA